MINGLTSRVAWFALAVALAGCAGMETAPEATDRSAKTFAVKLGMANVYVYRDEFLGAAVPVPVYVNDKLAGRLTGRTYLLLQLLPGKYTLRSATLTESSVTIEVAANRNYFIWQEMKIGLMGRPVLQIVEEAKGMEAVKFGVRMQETL